MRERLELVTAIVLSVCAAALHFVFVRSAGPLWRDEIVSVHVATSPPALLWQRLQFDSFPLLWPVVLRGWIALFGEESLRIFGALMGILIVAAIWIAARALGSRAPALALAIAAVSGALVRYGDSVRAYGLSIVAGLLSLAAIYAASRRRLAWWIAGVAAVVSVQTSFYNSVLLFAVCVAAAISARSIKPLVIGFIAALTLLPYAPVIRSRAAWASIETFGVGVRWIARQFYSTAGVMTIAVVIASLIVGARRRAWFPLVTAIVFTIGQFAFLRVLSYAPQPWYFVLLIAVIGLCADAMLTLRWPAAILVAAIALPLAFREASTRASNFDQVASALAAWQQPGDAVIVYPWYCGTTFNTYARATWMSLPPIADHVVQRYDLLLPQLDHPEAAAKPVADAATRALQSGHRVFLAGFPLCSESAAYLGDPATATRIARADAIWCHALAATLHADASRNAILVPPDPRTSIYERVQLIAFERTAR